MSSTRQTDKYGTKDELSRNEHDEGTAARTRPFNLEEIMLKRKQKKLTDGVKDTHEPVNLLGEANVDGVPHHLDIRGDHGMKEFVPNTTKNMSNDTIEEKNRKKETKNSIMESNFTKEKILHETRSSSKSKSIKDKSFERDKIEKQSHHRSKKDERINSEIQNELRKKSTNDTSSKHGDKNRSSHKDNKRKHLSGSVEKIRSIVDGSASKKPDSSKWHNTEILERKDRKKESSQSHYDEVKRKRRRSRSRDYFRERKSSSLSPRTHKHATSYGRDHEESSHHSKKDRSGRYDKNKVSANGSRGGGQYRGHSGHSSGLGGYSPRKRRTEAAGRTPSPTIRSPVRSPEKKSATWDHPPQETDKVDVSSFLTSFQLVQPVVESSSQQAPSTTITIPSITNSQPTVSTNISYAAKDTSIDSIQLTQATRPMRRLYVENVPASTTDKAIIECFNNFLLSSGVNHIQGTKPCISCIINKEKGQALVEFLTPEDATSALSFDGREFFGCTLKIRRPKDFIETPTRIPEKPAEKVASVSDVVDDSQHKIFIGGITKVLSSDMLLEIVGAFGLLKAYHFVVNKESEESFAFLEYADQSVTLKACAGLNGMKLGGNVLTAVPAILDLPENETSERSPFYGIPDHAKPLLEKPTQVLKIKNVFKQENILLLSESELEETLEDVRLECARFGTVKSVNFVRCIGNDICTSEAIVSTGNVVGEVAIEDFEGSAVKKNSPSENQNDESSSGGRLNPPDDPEQITFPSEVNNDASTVDEETRSSDAGVAQDTEATDALESEKPIQDLEVGESEPIKLIDDVTSVQLDLDETEDRPTPFETDAGRVEELDLDETEDRPTPFETDAGRVEELEKGNHLVSEDPVDEKINVELQNDRDELLEPIGENSDAVIATISEQACNVELFEQGSILVEFVRKEAACEAAHCLHRRIYGDQIVSVEYVPFDLFEIRFQR